MVMSLPRSMGPRLSLVLLLCAASCSGSDDPMTMPPPPTALDADADGIVDAEDNCPRFVNVDQSDLDQDGTGDVCDACPADPDDDADGDGRCADEDNCPRIANADQLDADEDGIGDVCDPCIDSDSDGLCGDEDNCPDVANADQLDEDGDGVGTACDPCLFDADNDADGDGVCVLAEPSACDGVADLVGHWTFEPGEELVDRTGSWGPLALGGAARTEDGQLVLDPTSTGHASDYTGAPIGNRTLVAWVRMDSARGLGPAFALTGGASTGLFVGLPTFEGRWNWGPLTTDNAPLPLAGIRDEDVGRWQQMALSVRLESDGARFVMCRDGISVGETYLVGDFVRAAGEGMIDFGRDPRFPPTADGITGRVEEARVYARAMTCAEVAEIGTCDTPRPSDNCPAIANPMQEDVDLDGLGDACDDDDDGDHVLDDVDVCPRVADPLQRDADGDGVGDGCDDDADDDGLPNDGDNCPFVANPMQEDATPADGQGDACDEDTDDDGVPDTEDNCVEIANPDQANAAHLRDFEVTVASIPHAPRTLTDVAVLETSVDGSTEPVDIGFPFEFFGKAQTQLRVTNIGGIVFDRSPGYEERIYLSQPATELRSARFGLFWAMDLFRAGRIRVGRLGQAPNRELVIHFEDVTERSIYGVPDARFEHRYDYQIVLREAPVATAEGPGYALELQCSDCAGLPTGMFPWNRHRADPGELAYLGGHVEPTYAVEAVTTGDLVGNACTDDDDDDGIPDASDPDADGDGLRDNFDLCVGTTDYTDLLFWHDFEVGIPPNPGIGYVASVVGPDLGPVALLLQQVGLILLPPFFIGSIAVDTGVTLTEPAERLSFTIEINRSSRTGVARLLSTFDGAGGVRSDELVLDIQGNSLRLIMAGVVTPTNLISVPNDDNWHEVGFEFNAGQVRLFVDGTTVTAPGTYPSEVPAQRASFHLFEDTADGTNPEEFIRESNFDNAILRLGSRVRGPFSSNRRLHVGAIDDDGDGVGDNCDTCQVVPNASQLDDDANGQGNACSEAANFEQCDDGLDGDGDTLVDCADPDCAGHPACP